MMRKFWGSHALVYPRRLVDSPLPDGAAHKAWQYAKGAEQWEGARRLLGHDGALRFVHSVSVTRFQPVAIVCEVPRLSDDYNADHERLSRFISAVFFGEPTEGLDAAPAVPEVAG